MIRQGGTVCQIRGVAGLSGHPTSARSTPMRGGHWTGCTRRGSSCVTRASCRRRGGKTAGREERRVREQVGSDACRSRDRRRLSSAQAPHARGDQRGHETMRPYRLPPIAEGEAHDLGLPVPRRDRGAQHQADDDAVRKADVQQQQPEEARRNASGVPKRLHPWPSLLVGPVGRPARPRLHTPRQGHRFAVEGGVTPAGCFAPLRPAAPGGKRGRPRQPARFRPTVRPRRSVSRLARTRPGLGQKSLGRAPAAYMIGRAVEGGERRHEDAIEVDTVALLWGAGDRFGGDERRRRSSAPRPGRRGGRQVSRRGRFQTRTWRSASPSVRNKAAVIGAAKLGSSKLTLR